MSIWGWTAIGVVLGVAAVWIGATLFSRRGVGLNSSNGGADPSKSRGTGGARRRVVVDTAREAAARQEFQLRREWLEARFFTLAAASGKPRGLSWVDCDFEDQVVFARERRTGELRALVGVTIRFEAVAGGGLEDNPNVSNLRAATAVFHHRDGAWETDGRSVFNLTPDQTVDHYQHELERT